MEALGKFLFINHTIEAFQKELEYIIFVSAVLNIEGNSIK